MVNAGNPVSSVRDDPAAMRRAYDDNLHRMPYFVISRDPERGFVARLHVMRPSLQALNFTDSHADIEILRRRLPEGMSRPRDGDFQAGADNVEEVWM